LTDNDRPDDRPAHEKHIRDYVVLHRQSLADLVHSVLGVDQYEQLAPERVGLLEAFEDAVFTPQADVRARNADHAKRQTGEQMEPPEKAGETEIVTLVAVPARQWSEGPVTLRNRFDVEVG
jgi:hypothetical protein